MPEIAVAEVSLISAEDFAALEAAAANPPAPAPEPKPEPPPPAPEPPPEPQPEASVPAPVETPDTNPVVEPVLPSTAPILPEAKPQPKPSDVVAPNPTDAPDAPSEPSPDAAPDVTEAPTPVPVEPPPPEAPAPADTGDVVETEENKDNTVAALAPRESGRPRSRPEKPPTLGANEPAPEVEAPSEPAPETPPEAEAPNDSDALAKALAEAQAEPEPAQPTGPPMTGSEKEALRVAVSSCWNVGSLSTAALQTEVVVGVSLGQNGMPDAASVRLLTFSGGSEAGAQQAFEAARRAIIRCGARGFPLPPEKYSQWKELELVFDPSGMRMR